MSVILQESRLDTPLKLKEVCARFFAGTITPATLKAEARRGKLVISKVGRAYFTTERAVNAMMEQCRVKQEDPISGSIPNEASGQSATEASASARASLRVKLSARKKLSKNI